MDNSGHHLVAIKFLSSIILGLIFAFLLVYVFTPEKRDYYPAFELEKERISSYSDIKIALSEDYNFPERAADYQEFKVELRERSTALMEAAKKSSLSVITSESLERVDGLRDDILAELDELRTELEAEENRLLTAKRSELEKKLSQELEKIRQEIKAKYSDYQEQEIRNNYLKIINLKIAVEVVAENAAQREKYQEQLNQVQAEQDQLLSEKKQQENLDIAMRTEDLIVKYNSEYSQYRQQILSEHQKIIAEREDELLAVLDQARKDIKEEMLIKRDLRAEEINKVIEESLAKYY